MLIQLAKCFANLFHSTRSLAKSCHPRLPLLQYKFGVVPEKFDLTVSYNGLPIILKFFTFLSLNFISTFFLNSLYLLKTAIGTHFIIFKHFIRRQNFNLIILSIFINFLSIFSSFYSILVVFCCFLAKKSSILTLLNI